MRPQNAKERATLRGAAPVFAVQDVQKSVAHYRDVLHFHTEFIYGQPPIYAGVERDNVLIHLQAARETERRPGQASLYVFVTDVDALFEELKSSGAKILKPPKDYDYGMRDFDIVDLDGNHLGFGMESKQT